MTYNPLNKALLLVFTAIIFAIYYYSGLFHSIGFQFLQIQLAFTIVLVIFLSIPEKLYPKVIRPILSRIRSFNWDYYFPTLSFIFIFSLLFQQLLSYWTQQTPQSNYLFGGFFPVVDSKNYFHGAISINEWGELTSWGSRRPLNHIFFAGLAWFSKMNFLHLFILLGFIFSGAISLLSSIVAKKFGKVAGLYIVLASFLFIRPYWGSYLSENYGFLFGVVATIFLLLGLSKKINFFYVAAISFYALALAGRSGSYFVIILLLFVPLLFKNDLKKKIILFVSTLAMLLLISNINEVIRTHFDAKGSAFSNLGVTLYGIARGGEGWTKYAKDYPNRSHLTPKQNEQLLQKVIIESIQNEPLLLAKGLAKGLKIYLSRHTFFLPNKFKLFETLSVMAFIIFILIRLKISWFLRQPILTTISLGFLGNLLAAPLLAQDGGQRVFAATILLNALFAIFAFNFIKNPTENLDIIFKNNSIERFKYRSIALAVISLLIITIPILLSSYKNRTVLKSHPCNKNERPVAFKYFPGTIMSVGGEKSDSRLIHISHEKLRFMTRGGNYEFQATMIKDDDPFYVVSTMNLISNSYEIIKLKNLPKRLKKGIHRACQSNIHWEKAYLVGN